jgi:hypothetical protein
MSATAKKATSTTPATEAHTVYRGPDRRDGEDRRHAGEQRQDDDRRSSTERRDPLRGELWQAGMRGEHLSNNLAFKLEPLLGLCEFATRAHYSLTAFNYVAGHDEPFRERLDGLDAEWRSNLDDVTARHIGEVLMLARDLCKKAADEAQAVAEATYAAMRSLEARQRAQEDRHA